MLTAILVIFCLAVWSAIVIVYFREEIRSWLDNRYGPDHRPPPKPKRKPFWRLYD